MQPVKIFDVRALPSVGTAIHGLLVNFRSTSSLKSLENPTWVTTLFYPKNGSLPTDSEPFSPPRPHCSLKVITLLGPLLHRYWEFSNRQTTVHRVWPVDVFFEKKICVRYPKIKFRRCSHHASSGSLKFDFVSLKSRLCTLIIHLCKPIIGVLPRLILLGSEEQTVPKHVFYF